MGLKKQKAISVLGNMSKEHATGSWQLFCLLCCVESDCQQIVVDGIVTDRLAGLPPATAKLVVIDELWPRAISTLLSAIFLASRCTDSFALLGLSAPMDR